MEVEKWENHPKHANHYFEFGKASWDNNEESVRRSVYNSTGTFSPHGSSEIPLDEVLLIVEVCIRNKKVSRWDTVKMLFSTLFKRK